MSCLFPSQKGGVKELQVSNYHYLMKHPKFLKVIECSKEVNMYTIVDHMRSIYHKPTTNDIIEGVKEYLSQKPIILKRSRQADLVCKRQFIAFVLRNRCNMSLSKIGEVLKMDHSNVVHMLKRHKFHIDTKDTKYLRNKQEIEEDLKDKGIYL